MSKATHDRQLALGEARLREWAVGDAAGVDVLRSLVGRDADVDLAIAVRLGRIAEPASVEALRAVEAATDDKLVQREVRRALYRLQQRGVAVPTAAVERPPVVAAPALEGYLSAVDGRGDQLVWLVKPHPGGLAHVFAVVNDPEGLRDVDLFETTRKALRATREELIAQHALRLVDADWHYCDFVLDRAVRWAVEQQRPMHGDYPAIRARLIRTPVTAMRPLIYAHLDAEALRHDARALQEAAEMLAEPDLRTWTFHRETLQPYLEAVQRIKDSPLVLNEMQQKERVLEVSARAVEALFGGDRQASWVRRFTEMAYYFHATDRPLQARRACATALALEASHHGGRGIPVCEALTGASLGAYLEAEETREAEEARTSLVVTPQQALREMQQQRRR